MLRNNFDTDEILKTLKLSEKIILDNSYEKNLNVISNN